MDGYGHKNILYTAVLIVSMFMSIFIFVSIDPFGFATKKTNYNEREKKLKEIHVEKVKAKEIDNFLNEKDFNKKNIYLKGNNEKIEKICKIYNVSFEDCNLIKWNNIKIIEIN